MREFGWILLGLGGLIALAGGLLVAASWLNLPLGKLPGDIRIEREGYGVYFPIVTCILLSVGLSALLWLVGRMRG